LQRQRHVALLAARQGHRPQVVLSWVQLAHQRRPRPVARGAGAAAAAQAAGRADLVATRERPRPILVRARGHTLVRAACRQGPQAGGRGSSGAAALGSLARSAARGRKNAAQGCPAAGSSPAGTTTGSCGRRASGTCSIRQPSSEHLTSRGRRLDCSGSGARTAAQGRSEVRATALTDNCGGGRALCPREEVLFHSSIQLGQLEAAGNALMTTVREA